MCDEYDQERMAMFWRKLESMNASKQPSQEPDEAQELLVRIAAVATEATTVKPRSLPR